MVDAGEQTVTKAYADYQASSPIHRLTVKVDLPVELEDVNYKKLEKKASISSSSD